MDKTIITDCYRQLCINKDKLYYPIANFIVNDNLLAYEVVNGIILDNRIRIISVFNTYNLNNYLRYNPDKKDLYSTELSTIDMKEVVIDDVKLLYNDSLYQLKIEDNEDCKNLYKYCINSGLFSLADHNPGYAKFIISIPAMMNYSLLLSDRNFYLKEFINSIDHLLSEELIDLLEIYHYEDGDKYVVDYHIMFKFINELRKYYEKVQTGIIHRLEPSVFYIKNNSKNYNEYKILKDSITDTTKN